MAKNEIESINGRTIADIKAREAIENLKNSGSTGTDGAGGISPVATVEQTDSGAVITITDANGTTTATVTNGKDGEDGQDGKDYVLTETDKTEIAELAAGLVDLPSGGGGEEWELMATVDMVQDAKYAQVDLPYPVKKLFVVCIGSDIAAATANGTFCIASGKNGYNNQKMAISTTSQAMKDTYKTVTIDIDLTRAKPLSIFQVGSGQNREYFTSYSGSMTPSQIFITSHDAAITFNAKTWYVYGVRA